jgi:hypothetical protein
MSISECTSIIEVAISFATMLYAIRQLKILTVNIEILIKSNIIHSTQTLLLIEDKIDDSRIEMENVSLNILRTAIPTLNEVEKQPKPNYIESENIINISIDRYLRRLDRLCSLYEKQILTKEQIINDYKSSIKIVMSEYKEKFDQHPDSYQHIRKINELIDLEN